jgi:type I restriction enzyme R subunit
MTPIRPDAEDALEQATIQLFAELGWHTVNCFHETFGTGGTVGRDNAGEVVLTARLRPALQRLNPDLPREAIDLAVDDLVRDRSALSPAQANREVYRLIKDGVKATFRDDEGGEVTETVRVIDWNAPENNDFLLASQLWATGELHKRRPDLLGFVNGLPLVLVELKASAKRLENAYQDNLRDYKDTIPQLFWYNALIILSNGINSRVGSTTASWEHFAEWKKISDEQEAGVISLETVIRGTCEQGRLLDLVENFTLFSDSGGALIKLLAKNHQFLGVNNAIDAVQNLRENQGRLGVFWHTQGSGKSYSMIFFSQKVLRKLPGNWTFLIVTDRAELDEQIYKNFADVGAVTEQEVQATSGEHLKQLLQENHRHIFTLIQKFGTQHGAAYPKMSDRADIIVVTDEAHRSQYDVLAANMRRALPNAAFIGFTGTPLMAGEEKTRDVFGDYVSVYDFRQSVEDRATVPLYYENRIPELQLVNDDLSDELQRILDAAELEEEQEKKLEREFGREYHLITRNDRLETIAEDIVGHFLGRGYQGKAMVVSIDKATAVRMYNKVQTHWKERLAKLKAQLASTTGEEHRATLEEQIRYMQKTDMAVVVSQAQNEIDDFRKKGLDMVRHRRRMIQEDLETRFKDPEDPFRIVFVTAMWMTGFDAPSVSTIYLDKPMRNHTLMQTIARANRVHRDKNNGLIVDYVGVFRNLQKALAIYGGGVGGSGDGATPVKNKQALVTELERALQETVSFLEAHGIDVNALVNAEGFARPAKLRDAREAMLVSDDVKKQYLGRSQTVRRLYKAVLPDPVAARFGAVVSTLSTLRELILAASEPISIDEVMGEIDALLDRSIAPQPFVIRPETAAYGNHAHIDLSQINFDLLRERFSENHKHTQTERLKAAISKKLDEMVQLNRTRADYLEKFQHMIDEYNSGSKNVEQLFDELLVFAKRLSEEEKRGIAEKLSEEELAVFDLLTKPRPNLTEAEERKVKDVAKELLATLKQEKLVLDWRTRQQSRAAVLVTVQEILDNLPRAYSTEMYNEKCSAVYQHIYDAYAGGGRSIYQAVA